MPLSPDEAVMSDLLEDLSAGQPPPPPDRYRAVRRRVVRRYWHQATTMGVVLAVLAAGLTLLSQLPSPALEFSAHASLPSTLASYLGVYEARAPDSYAPVTDFGQVAGRQPNLVGYVSGWAEPFNRAFAETAYRHHAAVLVQIDPSVPSVAEIADGTCDTYLRTYADSVAAFGHAVVIGFGHEMNAPWYSWGYGHVPAATFVRAWRHVVTLFRAEGADNVTWLWTPEADRSGTGPIADWWPGSKYVTWVGIDGYYTRPSDTFASVFGKTIDQVRQLSHKPVLLSEVAVAPAAGQFVKIQDLFQGMVRYRTLGVVWFDMTQDEGAFPYDWRIQDSVAAEASLRFGVRDDLAPDAPATAGG